MDPSSDQAWLERLRPPPEDDAVFELAQTLRRAISFALRGKGGSEQDVEDCVQEATLRVLDRLDTFRGESRLATWARSIAIHVALNHLRRSRAPTVSLDELGPVVRSVAAFPEERSAHGELIAALHEAINRDLTNRQRTAIQAMLAGVPLVVLAERMETNPNALYKLYHDARKRLRVALERSGYRSGDVRSLLGKESSRRG